MTAIVRKPGVPPRRGLGRGLSALLGEADVLADPISGAPESAGGQTGARGAEGTATAALHPDRGLCELPLDCIQPNPEQPRRRFDEAGLEELASSIRARGILQPILVRPDPAEPDRYQIVAGERRWRAASRAGLHLVPAVIREIDDRTMLEAAIIENVQRADLNPIEEAEGYAQLIDSFGYTQDELSRIVGKSRSHLANLLRLRLLPEDVQAMLREGRITAGHARALVTAPNASSLAREAVSKGMSVRQIEARAKEARDGMASRQDTGAGQVGAGTVPDGDGQLRPRPGKAGPRGAKDADTLALEGDLSAALGMGVAITHGVAGEGELRIRYRSLEDLDRLCQRLAAEP
ncbi:MAG: ParB/RepB/Spo0J family partition protein [Pikeienuella sp.]